MDNKKEYDKDKLSAFLSKVKTKLDQGIEDIGNDNKDIIVNWMEELKPQSSSDNILSIIYQKDLLNSPISTTPSLYDTLINQCHALINDKATITEKETIFTNITSTILTEENITSDTINLKEFEHFLLTLLIEDVANMQTENYINKAGTSIKVMSTLMKTINQCKEIPNHLLTEYCNEFTKALMTLIFCKDFRLRLCISNSINNIIGYMFKQNIEGNIIKIISLCYDDIFINFEQHIAKIQSHTICNDESCCNKPHCHPHIQNTTSNKATTSSNDPKDSHVTLDSSKNILLEALNQLPIDNGYMSQCQLVFIEKMNKMLSYLDTDDSIISVLLTIYEILTTYLHIPFYVSAMKDNILMGNKAKITIDFKEVILLKSSRHLKLIYPQVRYWLLKFLYEFNKVYKLRQDAFFIKNILPLICLNRYLPVDGVQKNSMILWKEVVENTGIELITDNFEAFLLAYIEDLFSLGQTMREGACRCIQEIIMKVYKDSHKDIIIKYHSRMLQGIIDCSKHPCWNVRETGLVAIAYVYNIIKACGCDIGDDLHRKVNDIIKYHCFDNIIEVRDASAFALRVFIGSNPNDLHESYQQFYCQLIKLLNDRSALENIHKTVKQEIFAMITSDQDFGFMREMDFIDFQDGILHIIKELSEIKENFLMVKGDMKLKDELMGVIDLLCKNHSTLTNLTKKTIWETLTALFGKITKDEVDMYLDYIIDILLKELNENRNSLSGFQAEKFITNLAQVANYKRMIKGKVRSKIKGNDSLTKLFDKILQ